MPARPLALVTGASDGIGAAIALDLARHGHDVALADLAPETLARTAAAVAAAGARAVPLALDLRSEASIAAAVAAAGPLDVLVNNAAVALNKPAVEVGWTEWDAVVDVNLKGTFFLSTAFARQCIAAGRPGAVVSLASTHGLTGLAGRSVYGASKGGVIQLTRMLAIEWAESGVRVNAVAPGTVLTPSRQAMLADPERRRRMLERIPTRRFPTAEEVAAAVRYLAGDEAGSVTGQVLPVDGGLTAA
jgi:2-deoxy-D-gluconate 3-dehydrogenase